ncbi:DMT family transporter [Cystobacter fuscus]|uniref:DMT family transporter n=1 Tax=Cystobacter fuscus TaxID=43 RepID=UPI002B320FB5|nr:DMT family transporter [Cystobacter fuscus]
MKTSYPIGIGSLALASTFIASANVAFARMVQHVPPVLLTLVAFTLSALVFGGLNRGRLPRLDKEAFRNILGLNIASACVFIFLYTALKYLEPSIASALQAGTTPVSAILILGATTGRWEVKVAEWGGSLVILSGCILLAWVSFTGRSGLGGGDTLGIVMGLVSVVISGVSTVFLTLCARRLTELGWSNLNILGHRFYVTIIASVLLCLGMGINPRELALDWRYVLPFCFVGVTVPLLFLQIGIRHVAPFVVVVMTNLNPILTFVIQLLDDRIALSFYTLAGVLLVLSGVLWVVHTKAKESRTAPLPSRASPARAT